MSEPRSEQHPNPRPDPLPDRRPEPRPEPWPEPKPEPRPVPRPGPQPDLRHAEAQPELWQGPQPAHLLSQQVVTRAEGTALRLFIAAPLRPSGAVLYMLDGGALPGLLLPDLLARHPGLAVVAVGYDTPRAFSPADRYFDYAPPLTPDEAAQLSHRVGGAAAFSALLTGDLRRRAEAGLQVDPRRRSLWGHSFAGLFVLNQLFTAPEGFAGYTAASPSLWAGEGTFAGLAAAAPKLGNRRLLVTLGDSESRSSEPPLTRPTPAPTTLRLVDRLAARGDLAVSQIVLPGAQHRPALERSLPFALEAAAGP